MLDFPDQINTDNNYYSPAMPKKSMTEWLHRIVKVSALIPKKLMEIAIKIKDFLTFYYFAAKDKQIVITYQTDPIVIVTGGVKILSIVHSTLENGITPQDQETPKIPSELLDCQNRLNELTSKEKLVNEGDALEKEIKELLVNKKYSAHKEWLQTLLFSFIGLAKAFNAIPPPVYSTLFRLDEKTGIVEVPRDGSCGYHSIRVALTLEGYDKSIIEMRKEVQAYLRDNEKIDKNLGKDIDEDIKTFNEDINLDRKNEIATWDTSLKEGWVDETQYNNIVKQTHETYDKKCIQSRADYISRCSELKFWAGPSHFNAFSNLLGRDIILECNGKKIKTWDPKNRTNEKALTIVFVDGNHFDSKLSIL